MLTDVDSGHVGLREWGIRLMFDYIGPAGAAAKPTSPELNCTVPADRLAYASGLRQIPAAHRFPWAAHLLSLVTRADAKDANLPLMTWYAIEPVIGNDREETRKLLRSAQLPLVREYIARKAVSKDLNYAGMMLAWGVESSDHFIARDMLQGINDGLGGIRQVQSPSIWVTAGPKLLSSRYRDIRERAMTLAVTFGDRSAIATMMKTTADAKADRPIASPPCTCWNAAASPTCCPSSSSSSTRKPLRPEAIRGLAAFNDAGTPALLLKLYPNLTDAEKQDAVADVGLAERVVAGAARCD